MLDVVYYPVSAVLWLWHSAFASVPHLPAGPAWVLAVFFLVATFRAVLLPFSLRQARNQAALKRLQPRMAAITRAHPDDRRKQAEAVRALHAEHGVGMFVGCLPALGQALVFLGLFHVLRSFDRTATPSHLPFQAIATPMTPEQNAATANYVFDPEQVRSFLDADLFGAPLSATRAAGPGAAVAIVSITLMLIAAVATHLTARIAVARQDTDTPQTRVMNSMTLWVFPAGVLVGGALLPVVVLLYWVANNAWTVAQQFLVHRRVDAEFAALPPLPVPRTATAPRPGAEPRRRPV